MPISVYSCYFSHWKQVKTKERSSRPLSHYCFPTEIGWRPEKKVFTFAEPLFSYWNRMMTKEKSSRSQSHCFHTEIGWRPEKKSSSAQSHCFPTEIGWRSEKKVFTCAEPLFSYWNRLKTRKKGLHIRRATVFLLKSAEDQKKRSSRAQSHCFHTEIGWRPKKGLHIRRATVFILKSAEDRKKGLHIRRATVFLLKSAEDRKKDLHVCRATVFLLKSGTFAELLLSYWNRVMTKKKKKRKSSRLLNHFLHSSFNVMARH